MSINTEYTLSKHGHDFIDDHSLEHKLKKPPADAVEVRDIIARSLDKQPLTVDETACLLRVENRDLVEEIFDAARTLKRKVYGNRIVLFAPFYIGNACINDCAYCAFRKSNRKAVRRTLNPEEIREQVTALLNKGHKRLILVFGEHPRYNAEFIADTVKQVYSCTSGHGEIRRVNINAAPLDHEGFKTIHDAGIGTYQIFQETYHHETYKRYHPADTPKGDYLFRLDGLSRAFEVGCDDMGIGALFGLYDWRFEVLGLVSHARFLQSTYGVGPHTISFPRLKPAHNITLDSRYLVNDYDFKRLVAILRLSVPYTGMILTAREDERLRNEIMAFGVSQIDAGSRIEIGGYAEYGDAQVQNITREQFRLGDLRSLDTVIRSLLENDYIPSFCTACYRCGRTGEQFMEFAIPGFIEKFCTPNAILTLQEYLTDYGSDATKKAGAQLIEKELAKIENKSISAKVKEHLIRIRETEDRDFYF